MVKLPHLTVSDNEEQDHTELVNNTTFVSVKVEVGDADVKTEIHHDADNSELKFSHVTVKQEPYSVLEPLVIIAEESKQEELVEAPVNYCTREIADTNNADFQGHENFDETQPHVTFHNIKILPEDPVPTESISCPTCHKLFVSRGNLQRHLSLHEKPKFTCEHCKRRFYNQTCYDKHMISHNGERPYQCNHCDKSFKTTSNLYQHNRVHEKPFTCDLCGHTFASRNNLKKHRGKSQCIKRKGPIQCNVCFKIFTKEWLLKSHQQRHVKEKPFQCDLCKMYFKSKNTILRHIQLHNGDRPFSCRFCQMRFTRYSVLRVHLRIHTGDKPYKCPLCEKYFTEKYNMQRHVSGHCKVKRLTCDICQKKFPRESRLKYHMRTHIGVKPFSCSYCTKKFSHKQNVVRHYQRKHPGKTYASTETDASFALKVWDSIVKQPEVLVHNEEILP